MRRYAGGDWLGYYRGLYASEAPGWAVAQAKIGELAWASKARNIDLVIASYPELHQLDPYPFTAVNDALATLASDLGILFIDLLPAVANDAPRALWVTSGDAHPNTTAHRKYAGRLATALQGLIDR